MSSHPYTQELYRRVIWCLSTLTLLLVLLISHGAALYHAFAAPLLRILPEHSHVIATHLLTPWMSILKLCLYVALILVMPLCLYHLGAFIQPALYRKEKKLLYAFLLSGLLFYVGMSFAYWGLLPWLLQWLVASTPADITLLPDMGQFLDLVLWLLLFFGLAFEIPLVIYSILKSGYLSAKQLANKRKYWVITSFAAAMLVAPDMLSQVIIALPLWGLFELGLWLGSRIK